MSDPGDYPPPTEEERRGFEAEDRDAAELWRLRLAGRWGPWPQDRDEDLPRRRRSS